MLGVGFDGFNSLNFGCGVGSCLCWLFALYCLLSFGFISLGWMLVFGGEFTL